MRYMLARRRSFFAMRPRALSNVDPYNVVLLHLNSDFTDMTGKVWTARNGATIDSVNYKYGGGSLATLRNGTPPYINTPDHVDFTWGNGSFTWTFYVRIASLPASGNGTLFEQYTDANNYYRVRLYTPSGANVTVMQFNVKSAGVTTIDLYFTFATPLTIGAFYEIELGRSGNNFYAFANGVASTSNPRTSTASLPDLASSPSIASSLNSETFAGNIDEVRLRKGICDHTASYTPNTAEFP